MQEEVYSKQAMNEVDAGRDLATPSSVGHEESLLCSNLIHRFALNNPSSFSPLSQRCRAAGNARLIGILGRTQVARTSGTTLALV
jgi:hypothetical protein